MIKKSAVFIGELFCSFAETIPKRYCLILALAVLLLGGTANALTLSQIRTAIRLNIHDSATSSSLRNYSDTTLNSLINEAQRDIVNNTWIISKSSTSALSNGTTYYLLSDDTIQIHRVSWSSGQLPEIMLTQVDSDNNNTNWEIVGGTPIYYFQDRTQSNKIGLQPYPSGLASPGNMKVMYFTYAATLSSDSDIPFNAENRFVGYHDLLIYFSTFRIHEIEGDLAKSAMYRQMYDNRIQVMNSMVGNKINEVEDKK